MKLTFLLKIMLPIVAVLAGLGFIPAVYGPVSSLILSELNKIPVEVIAESGIPAVVERVVDGDTIEVTLQGPDLKKEMLRLVGVDTPETKHPRMPVQFFGPEATQFVKSLCDGTSVFLHLQKDGPERGAYKRLLVYVELPGGKILNEEIIKNGFGYSYSKYPHEQLLAYEKLQDEAKAAKRGLWASVKFEDLPAWLREAKPDILK